MLDRNHGRSLGVEGREAFNETLRRVDVIQRCVPAWQRPPGLDRYRAELEIRLRAVDDGYRVEDVLVLDSNISDPDLEACLREAYLGVAIAMSGPAPASGARIVFPVVIHFRHPR